MQYYAHISEDKTRKQTVKDHLTGTARRSDCLQKRSGAEHGDTDAEFCTISGNIPRDLENVWRAVPLRTTPRREPRR